MSHEIRTPLNGVLPWPRSFAGSRSRPTSRPSSTPSWKAARPCCAAERRAGSVPRRGLGPGLDEEPMQPAALLDEAASPWSALAELKGPDAHHRLRGRHRGLGLGRSGAPAPDPRQLGGQRPEVHADGGVTIRLSTRVEGACLHVSGVVAGHWPRRRSREARRHLRPFQQTAEGVRKGGGPGPGRLSPDRRSHGRGPSPPCPTPAAARCSPSTFRSIASRPPPAEEEAKPGHGPCRPAAACADR
jgi:hypothetical protein